jgi:hypothetical protein
MSHFFPPLTDCFGPSQLLTREKPDLVLARCAELSADLRAPARCNWRYHAAHAGADGLSFVVERARDELPANLASPLIPRRWSKPLPHHSLGASFFGKPSPLLVDVIYSDTVPVAQRRTWRLGILSSHGGTNFNAIAEAIAQGHLNATIAVAICNNPGAKTFDIATAHGVPAELINGKNHPG